MSDVTNILLLAILGSFIALGGGVVFLYSKKWSAILAKYSIPFAAGVLLTVSLVGLLPEAVHAVGENAYAIVLLSFLAAYVFEHLFFDIHHHEGHVHAHSLKGSIPLVILGDTIHNFIDGVAIAATYMVNPGLGLITSLSTLLHEVPHEIGDFGVLLAAGWKKAKIFWVNVLSASTTLLGALFVVYFTQSEEIVGVLLAIAAGLFLYLGASDFLPHVHEGKTSSKVNIIALFVGVFLMLGTFMAIPHSHGEEGHADHGSEEMMHEEDDHDQHEDEVDGEDHVSEEDHHE